MRTIILAVIAILIFAGILRRVISHFNKKPGKRIDGRYTIRTYEEGGDPVKDRIEFHCRKRG